MNGQDETLMTRPEVAKLFGVSTDSVDRWAQKEEAFPPALGKTSGRTNSLYVYNKTDIIEFGIATGRWNDITNTPVRIGVAREFEGHLGTTRYSKDPSTFVLVKLLSKAEGRVGVLVGLDAPEGTVKGWSGTWPSTDNEIGLRVVQYPTAEIAQLSDGRTYGGVPHTYVAGHEVVDNGVPTHTMDVGVGRSL